MAPVGMSDLWPPLGPDYTSYDGDWSTFLADCYDLYSADFLQSVPRWPVNHKRFAI